MQGAVRRWGNSIAVRIPKSVAQDAHLAVGDTLNLKVEGGRIIMTPARKRYKLKELLAHMPPEQRRGETDWGEAQGEEVW